MTAYEKLMLTQQAVKTVHELAPQIAQYMTQVVGPVPNDTKDAYYRGIKDALVYLLYAWGNER